MNKQKKQPIRIGGDVNSLHIEGINALGDLERDVMEVIWSAGEPVTVKEVIQLLRKVRREMAYTTVMTVMNRLVAKELLKQDRSRTVSKTQFIYEPTLTQEQYDAQLVEKTVGVLAQFNADALIRSVLSNSKAAGAADMLVGAGSF